MPQSQSPLQHTTGDDLSISVSSTLPPRPFDSTLSVVAAPSAPMVVSSPRPNGANSSINGAVNRSSPKNLVKVNGVKPQVSSSKPSPLANGSSSKVPQSPGKVLSAISNLESTISADNVAPQTSRSRPATPCDATFIVRAATHFGDTVHLARGERQERPSELYCEREGVWTTTAKFEVPADLSTVRFGHAHANSPIRPPICGVQGCDLPPPLRSRF